MIKALWFMVKVGLLAALAIWIAEQSGDVRIVWQDYVFTIDLGFFLLIMLAVILVALFLYSAIKAFIDFPKSYKRYREIKSFENGYRALTVGLTAVAVGDTKTAVKHARKASRLLPDDGGLPLLLQAQAARLDGREEDAHASFSALLEHKDASFLGVRGLLQAALDAGDYPKALELAQHALKLHPRQPWILRVVYDLQLKLRAWNSALDTLYMAEKARAITYADAKNDRVAIWLAQADEDLQRADKSSARQRLKKAFAQSPGFAPAALRLAKFYNNNGKRSKAVAVVERAWKIRPHPDLIDMWAYLLPPGKGSEPLAQIKWFEKLLDLNPQAAEGHMALGYMALKEQLWGEARTHLEQAAEMAPNAEIYKMLAELAKRSGQGEVAQQTWLDKAEEALPAPVWICSETGRIYDEWSPVALPHGSFNSIEWSLPHNVGSRSGYIGSHNDGGDMLIEAPTAARS